MLRLNIPTVSYAKQEVSLGGFKYDFVYSYNEYDGRWRIDIYYNEELIVPGLAIMEDSSIIRFRYDVPEFSHGDLQCRKVLDTKESVGRNNLGIGKEYELIYFTNEELGL